MVAGQTVRADSPEKREVRTWAEESMAQGQRRGCPRRALGAGCFLAEEVPFKLRLGQFLEECWSGGAQKQGRAGWIWEIHHGSGARREDGWTCQDLILRGLGATGGSWSFSLQVNCVPQPDARDTETDARSPSWAPWSSPVRGQGHEGPGGARGVSSHPGFDKRHLKCKSQFAGRRT